jgi:Icc protein
MRILHLSDCHIPRATGPGAGPGGTDPRAILAGLLADCAEIPGIDLVVVSGDVANDGSPEGYAAALDLIGGFAAARGIPQVYCTGNHDERDAFAAVLGTGHRDPSARDAGRLAGAVPGERAAVSEVAGYRVITLDSLLPGEVYGLISTPQLAWLSRMLADPAPAGSVVVLHHPPIGLSRDPQSWAGLRNAADLGTAIAGSDVQAVLCGHFHSQLAGQLAGVPVWAGPAVVTRIDLTAPDGIDRVVRGAAATVADFGGPGSPLFHVVHARDPLAGQALYVYDGRRGEIVPAGGA